MELSALWEQDVHTEANSVLRENHRKTQGPGNFQWINLSQSCGLSPCTSRNDSTNSRNMRKTFRDFPDCPDEVMIKTASENEGISHDNMSLGLSPISGTNRKYRRQNHFPLGPFLHVHLTWINCCWFSISEWSLIEMYALSLTDNLYVTNLLDLTWHDLTWLDLTRLDWIRLDWTGLTWLDLWLTYDCRWPTLRLHE